MSRVSDVLARGTTRYFQPQQRIRTLGVDNTPESGLDARLARLVGLIALGLPLVLLLTPVVGGCFRDSISHHYYEPLMGPVFVGMLSFIGGFLIAYKGEHWAENLGATLAGFGAFGVATWPTTKPGCEKLEGLSSRAFVTTDAHGLPTTGAGFELFAGVENLHGFSAAVVFGFLALYVLFVLRRVVPARHMRDGQIIPTKRRRNILYSLTGTTILLCIAVLGLKMLGSADFLKSWNGWNATFWVEAVALWAFAIAWLARGRLFPALNDPA